MPTASDANKAQVEPITYIPFDCIDFLEDVSRYNPGGFHPVHLGDALDTRFEVVHKLGHGGFGVVWLCREVQTSRWRAVKILAADSSPGSESAPGVEEGAEGDGEGSARAWGDLKTTQHLKARTSTFEEIVESHIAFADEVFWIEGPNGRHLCLVMEVFGEAVNAWCLSLEPTDPKTLVAVKNVCRQITLGLQFLHNHGICHGDLRPSNVLMRLGGLDELSKEELITLVGEPNCFEVMTSKDSSCMTEEEKEQVQTRAPRYCVQPAPYKFRPLYTGSVAIVDFGEAFHVEAPRRTTGIPITFSAPENLLGVGTSFGSDIWSLACTIYELRTVKDLFGELPDFSGRHTASNVVSAWKLFLGPLVDPYKTIWRSQFVNVSSSGADGGGSSGKSWEDEERSRRLKDSEYSDILEADLGSERMRWRRGPDGSLKERFKYRYSRDEVVQLADLLRKMWRYDPDARLGLDAILDHPWLREPDNFSPLSSIRSRLAMIWGSIRFRYALAGVTVTLAYLLRSSRARVLLRRAVLSWTRWLR